MAPARPGSELGMKIRTEVMQTRAVFARGRPIQTQVRRLEQRLPGSARETPVVAQRKAYTARTFGRTSAEWASRTEPGSELAGQRQLEHVIALRGGVPIKVGDDTIGAVGVSGSTSGGDEACAMAGVARVADQLK